MPKKRGYNLKKGKSAGDFGRQKAHLTKSYRERLVKTGSGGLTTKQYREKYPKSHRAEYGSRVGIKKYKPRKKA